MISRYPRTVLDYIADHIHTDPVKILLGKSPFPDIDTKELASQIIGRKIADKKFPFLTEYEHYRFPVKTSLEQSSSEQTARYKSRLVSGHSLVDLTGGMGMDTYFFSKTTESISYVEIDKKLCDLATYNFKELNVNIEVHNESAEDFLCELSAVDWLYIDPSRRIDGNKKTSIKNLVPDVIDLLPLMLTKSAHIMIKLSPMQDICEAIRELSDVKEVHIVALRNEVKELLLIIDRGHKGEIKISAVDIMNDAESKTTVDISSTTEHTEVGPVKRYLYQPSSAIVKAGLHNHVANIHNLVKLHNNTQLYTSDEIAEGWTGRIFEIIEDVPLQKKVIGKLVPEKQINIISKNHPLKPAQIANKIGFVEGGVLYLIAATDAKNRKVAWICSRLVQ